MRCSDVRRRQRQPLRVAQVARVLQRDAQGERVPGRPRLDAREELADVAHARRERGRALGPGRIVPEQPAELLQVRAAAGRVDDDRLDPVERRDQPTRERLALLEPARVDRERAAAALRWRDDLVAVGREHAGGRGVDRAEHRRLHAACENADAPARLAPRGRNSWPPRSSATAARSPRAAAAHVAGAPGARAPRGAAPLPSASGRGGAGRAESGRGARSGCAETRARRVARRLDQPVVPDTGRARRHARHAAEAAVEVLDDRAVERDRAVEPRLHQLDAAARRVHLLAPEQVRRAGRQAEAAVDAVARQLANHRRSHSLLLGDGRREEHGRPRRVEERCARTRSFRAWTASGVSSAVACGT